MAEALLLQDVENLGERGDVVDVSPGYLRNFLAPRKLAEPATAKTVAQAKRLMEEAEKAAIDRAERAGDIAALLNKTVLTMPLMQEWIDAARAEPEELEELDVEF